MVKSSLSKVTEWTRYMLLTTPTFELYEPKNAGMAKKRPQK